MGMDPNRDRETPGDHHKKHIDKVKGVLDQHMIMDMGGRRGPPQEVHRPYDRSPIPT